MESWQPQTRPVPSPSVASLSVMVLAVSVFPGQQMVKRTSSHGIALAPISPRPTLAPIISLDSHKPRGGSESPTPVLTCEVLESALTTANNTST